MRCSQMCGATASIREPTASTDSSADCARCLNGERLSRCALSYSALSAANRWLFLGWVSFATANSGLMFAVPGKETIPFHFVYISMAVVYGFQPWLRRKTYAVLGLVAL